MQNTFNKTNRNKSSIDFNPSLCASGQFGRVFTQKSEIGELMSQAIPVLARTESKFYENRIFNSCKKYDVLRSEVAPTSNAHQQFYLEQHKFVKPYSDNTKYADTLSRNRSLLRRGLFNKPVEQSMPISSSHLLKRPTQNNYIYKLTEQRTKGNLTKSYFKTKPSFRGREIANGQRGERGDDPFDRTIGNELQRFDSFLNKERSHRSEMLGMQNSMNRLLGAELVNTKLRQRQRQSRTILY